MAEMKNALIITLGSRDIQIDDKIPDEQLNKFFNRNSDLNQAKEFPGVLFVKSARKHGKIINDNYEYFKEYLKYPIVKPAIEYVKSFTDIIPIDLIIVYTDQERTNPERSYGDTRFFAQIIIKLIKKDFSKFFNKIHTIKVDKGVTEYDTMYDFFTEKFKEAPMNEYERSDRIFLLPQGGIDQINTTLLLKCFENFPNLVQLAKPEGKNDVITLKFNRRFYTALNKKKILYAINNFYYHLIDEELTTNPLILLYARYASVRLSLNIEVMKEIWNKLLVEDSDGWARNNLHLPKCDEFNRQREYYLALKVTYQQENYTDFMVRLSNLHENMLKQFISETFGVDLPYDLENLRKQWKILLDRNEQLRNFLANYRIETSNALLNFEEPSKFIYQIIFENFAPEDVKQKLMLIFDFMNKASEKRNATAHRLEPVLKKDIDKIFNGKENVFFEKLDAYFSVKDFDVYDILNKRIASLLE